jgi:16S rRNA (cytosine1402-N4)-methyltransferase
MNKEVIEILGGTDKKLFIDCTLGMGGHSYHILKHFKGSRVVAIDVDQESIKKAKMNLKDFKDRILYYKFNFIKLFEKKEIPVQQASGVLIDPGISTFQLKKRDRGFSHNVNAPLDMRKDKTSELTAAGVINSYQEKELIQLFKDYGEVRDPAGFAKKIIETRLFQSIETTNHLKDIIEKYYSWKPKQGKSHPAAKVFQALRIAVNKELDGVEDFLLKAAHKLKRGARIVFLTFHSVEDRIVKKAFNQLRNIKKVKIIKPFPAFPSEDELKNNLASRSVKLRAVEVV